MLELFFLLVGLFVGWNTDQPQISKNFKNYLLTVIKEQTEKNNGSNKN